MTSQNLEEDLGIKRRSGPDQSRRLKYLYQIHRTDPAHRNEPATVYYATETRPGSWVVEYWFYYPIDEGGLDEHLHDSEHLFVEVDKLGGIVRRVVGAGHGDWAPNNEFGTFKPSAIAPRLPLRAIVERGKHATAADIDHDGRFVPGVDTNLYRDAGKVWGIRDATGETDAALKAFTGSMMVDRTRTLTLRTQTSPTQTTQCEGNSSVPTCYVLRPLQAATTKKCDEPNGSCAESQIAQHPDRKNPNKVLKEGFFPAVSVRYGGAYTPTTDSDKIRSTEQSFRHILGFTTEISSIPIWRGKRLPLPGRIAIDSLWDSDLTGSGVFDGIAGRYETMVSNLFTAFIGITKDTDEINELPTPQPEDPSRATWLTAGGGFERPLWIFNRLTFNVQAGLMFNNFYGLRSEFRGGIGFSFGTGNRRFGIPRRTANPFSH
jgi:hypothetical protein